MPSPQGELTDWHARLRALVESLSGDQLRASAYPTEWTVADVLSHLGSAAVINRRRLDDALADRDLDDSFAPTVWETWNAKTPESQAADLLTTSGELIAALAGLSDDERAGLKIRMGPVPFDVVAFEQLLLNEATLHTWDVAVTLDPAATLDPGATALVIDHLGMIAGWGGRASGDGGVLEVRTTAPERRFTLTLGPERVSLEPSTSGDEPGLTLPAEAFVRLVYGRLDADHTPAGIEGGGQLDRLRDIFRGV
jgi:uncharacterized protein (TIGR03083 family)